MTSELDPAGVLTRSDEGDGYVSLRPEPIRPREREASRLVPRWWPAALALLLVVAVIVLDAVAVSLAGSGSFAAATVVAWVAIVLSVVAVVGGAAAVVVGVRSRLRSITVLGLVAVLLGVLANPWLLARVLELVG